MNKRLVLAETLKLRKSRGLVIASVAMTLGVGVLIMVIPELYRLAHPSISVVGGQRGLQRGGITLGVLGSIAAMIVGSAAGTNDLSSGIFRDLVATGRSRSSLFAARVPGALLYWVPVITMSYLVIALVDLAFSNHSASSPLIGLGDASPRFLAFFSGATPPLHQYVDWYLWVLLYTCFVLLVTIGLASWVGSRAITLGILIPFELFVAAILAGISQLGAVREILYPQSISRLAPSIGPGGGTRNMFGQVVTHSAVIAWVVLVVWIAAMLAAGAWRTMSRDA